MNTEDKNSLYSQNLNFYTKYSSLGASSRYRTLQYLPFLPTTVNYRVEPLFDDSYLKSLYQNKKKPLFNALNCYLKRLVNLTELPQSPSLILENELWPYLPYKLEEAFLKEVKKLVLIYDDAIFHHYDQSKNPYLKANKNKIGRLMQRANSIIVGNSYLAEYANHWNSQVHIIPTVIDGSLYSRAKNYTNTSSKLMIVWVGSPATAHYLYSLASIWGDSWVQANTELVIIGANDLKLPQGLTVKYIPWSSETEITEIQNCDLGIMPLSDDPWSRGKCGFKLIQYMAAGLPCIASAVGANKEIIVNGETGFLVKTNAEWLLALKEFYNEKYLLETMGRRARERAFAKYTLQATYQQWLNIILDR
jgi:glycosyltransferase involved in cell wall biosynthesis